MNTYHIYQRIVKQKMEAITQGPPDHSTDLKNKIILYKHRSAEVYHLDYNSPFFSSAYPPPSSFFYTSPMDVGVYTESTSFPSANPTEYRLFNTYIP